MPAAIIWRWIKKRFKSRLEDAKKRVSEKDYRSFSGTRETGALKRARLDLQNITAICLQGRDNGFDGSLTTRSKKLLEYMVSIINFHKIIFISPVDPEVEGVEYIYTDPVDYYYYNI